MIDFLCQCRNPLSVPSELAGGTIQCPRCGRLNDVPNLSELPNIEADGTFKLDAIPLADEPDRIDEVARVFGRKRTDDYGDEIDLRPTVDEFLRAGTRSDPAELEDEFAGGVPKYDPITGELLEAIQVRKEESDHIRPQDIPMAGTVINYAPANLAKHMSFAKSFSNMFTAGNLAVVAMIVVAHIFTQGLATMVVAGIFFMFPVVFIMLGSCVFSHYSNVIEEAGPGDFDEFPRPLRDLSLSEDLWSPFVRMSFSLMVCFLPAGLMLLRHDVVGHLVSLVLGTIGFILFPGVLLTATTSGTWLNLRPDRVLGTIAKCGFRYVVVLFVLAIALPIYAVGLVGPVASLATLFVRGSSVSTPLMMWGITMAALIVSTFLLHYAAYLLGLLYRAEHAAFPWVMQRHVSSRRTDTMKKLEQRRARTRMQARAMTAPSTAGRATNAPPPPPSHRNPPMARITP